MEDMTRQKIQEMAETRVRLCNCMICNLLKKQPRLAVEDITMEERVRPDGVSRTFSLAIKDRQHGMTRPEFGDSYVEYIKDNRTVSVDLSYPRLDDNANKVEVGICDVRAADNIQIEYDFERDGWSIKQASTFEWDADDKVCDPDWQEVAFVQAWGREKTPALNETPRQ